MVGSLEAAVRFLQWLSVVGVAVSSLACAPKESPERAWTRDLESFPLPVWTTDGLYLVSGRSGALFLRPPLSEFERYRGVVVEEIRITMAPDSRKLTSSERQRLEGYFTRRLDGAFERSGWRIVDDPGDDVLRLRLAVKDLELQMHRRSHYGNVVSGVSTEKIAIALELRDATGSERMLLYGDRRRLPFRVYSGSDAISLRRVEDAFYDFAIDVGRRLDQMQRGDFPPPPHPDEAAPPSG